MTITRSVAKNAMIVCGAFAAVICALIFVGPFVVQQAVVADARIVSYKVLDRLKVEFDLPGRAVDPDPTAFETFVKLITGHSERTRNEFDLFRAAFHGDDQHFGKTHSYAIYTTFGDRFLRGGNLPAARVETPVYARTMDSSLAAAETRTVTLKHKALGNVTTTFIPLLKNGTVRAVALIEVTDRGIEAIVSRSVQAAGAISSGIVTLFFLGFILLLHGNARARDMAESKAEFHANCDLLTQLPNRLNFERRAADLMKDTRFAMLIVDIDNFKEVNDRFGHASGDEVLVHVAQALRVATRGAFVARWAGDEFVVILERVSSERTIFAYCDVIFEALSVPCRLDGNELTVSVCIGSALYQPGTESFERLLGRVDLALYAAKEMDGKGAHVYYHPDLEIERKRRLQLTQKLETAVADGALHLVFQPQCDLVSRKVTGFEALLRWTDPELGEISPAEFIPIAENSGLIVAIGNFVLHEACRQAAAWPDSDVSVAVNVSSMQLSRNDFLNTVSQAIKVAGLAPERLELELTESVLIDWCDETAERLDRLREMNVRIAMDDFGTGHSSLTYLARMPFTKMKIDRTFVGNVGDGGTNDAIINAIIGLADRLSLDVIAEGVETHDQLTQLMRMGCTSIQGYLFGRPVAEPYAEEGPAKALLDRLHAEVAISAA